jgi:hypothetical protein
MGSSGSGERGRSASAPISAAAADCDDDDPEHEVDADDHADLAELPPALGPVLPRDGGVKPPPRGKIEVEE